MIRHTLALAAICALALCACATTPAPGSSGAPPQSSQVTVGQALYGAVLGADLAVKTLQTEKGALGASGCATVARLAPDAVTALGLASRAYANADLPATQQAIADAAAILPVLTQLAAAPAATPTAVAKPTTAQDIAAAVAAATSAALDVQAVRAADTVPALQAAIPGALAALQMDTAGFGC